MSQQLILKMASSQLGVKEVAGDVDEKTIVQYSHDIGLMWINDDETPWCAIFVWWVLMKCGLSYKADARAVSLAEYGTKTTTPQTGDLVVFVRKGGHHVGFFLGYVDNGSRISVLGGNQGNQVSIAKYSLENILCFRRPSEAVSLMPEIPDAPVDKGSIDAVKKLQQCLLYLGLYPGKVDGLWGDGTQSAVIKFQTKYGLTTSGAYSQEMKDKLFSILNN